jgi:AraC-like DNA-binding protein
MYDPDLLMDKKEIVKQNLVMKEMLKFVRDVAKRFKQDHSDIARNLHWTVKDVQAQLGISDYHEAKELKDQELRQLLDDRYEEAKILIEMGQLSNIYLDAEDEVDIKAKKSWKSIKKNLLEWLERRVG